MKTQIKCGTEERRIAVKNHPKINGINYMEVFNRKTLDGEILPPFLLLFCFKEILGIDENNNPLKGLRKDNVVIEGGFRTKNIQVERVERAGSLSKSEKKKISKQIQGIPPSHVLVVVPNSGGDFSTYTLRLVRSKDEQELPPVGFDPLLSEIGFSFKVECPAEFDCLQTQQCPPEVSKEPVIDYMAKDYASFRQLILDRLSMIMPNWKERNPADLGIVLVELLAYMGDYLSYYQDAVATEAYLGTARSRVSVRRHARLLDYSMHNGCNARAWICLEAKKENNERVVKSGTRLLTGGEDESVVAEGDEVEKALARGERVFETMHKIELSSVHNKMKFYTWGNHECYLPKGATQATLLDEERTENNPLKLKVGDFIVLEETQAPGCRGYVDPLHRHVVRLTKVSEGKTDELSNTAIVDIEWSSKDALPFPLCLWEESEPKSVARGNVVLADYGYTVPTEQLQNDDEGKRFRPCLSRKPITYRIPLKVDSQTGEMDFSLSATSAFNSNIREAKPAVLIEDEERKKWEPQQDLLSSDRFKREFVVEVENDGTAKIRFGDDKNGMDPESGVAESSPRLDATYRIGNGTEGNVGAESITRIIKQSRASDDEFFADYITKVRNPLPARGGIDSETNDEVRQYAPQAFRVAQRAVTEADYAEILKREHPEVQRATSLIRWTGSWYTIFITVDRYGGREVDEEFKTELCNLLNRYRLAGYDVEINGPTYVPLDISMKICVCPDRLREEVKKVLIETFSNKDLTDGRRGYFHPDNFTFGQSLYLSQIIPMIRKIKGVRSVELQKFQRLEKPSSRELEDEVIKAGPFEIIQLENDPNFPQKGKIEFIMEGGR